MQFKFSLRTLLKGLTFIALKVAYSLKLLMREMMFNGILDNFTFQWISIMGMITLPCCIVLHTPICINSFATARLKFNEH